MAAKRRIYVLDDELVVARTLCLILDRAGYETSMFHSAEAALAAIRQQQPDLVLSDVVMTGEMNGLQLAELISHQFPSVSVIPLSGQAQTSELLNGFYALGLKPNVHMKPLLPDLLLREIKQLLDTYEPVAA